MHSELNQTANWESRRNSGESQKPGLLFSIVAFFGGAWYFLDQRIVQLTSSNSGVVAVTALVVANFLCFTYLVGFLICLYVALSGKPFSARTGAIHRFCVLSWPTGLISVVVALLAGLLPLRVSMMFQLVLSVGVTLLLGLYLLYAADSHAGTDRQRQDGWVLPRAFVVVIAYLIYLVVMSCLHADVQITLIDRTANSATVAVHTIGFFEKPKPVSLEDAAGVHPIDQEERYVVALDPHGPRDVITARARLSFHYPVSSSVVLFRTIRLDQPQWAK